MKHCNSVLLLAILSLPLGCAASVADEDSLADESEQTTQDLTFSSSNDAQSNASQRVVSILDGFQLHVASAKVTDVSWAHDDMKITICLRDDIANVDVQCISGKKNGAVVGSSIPFSTNDLWFQKGRNSFANPGSVSPGTTFSIRMRLDTTDGADRSVTRTIRYHWDGPGRTYYRSTNGDAGCGEGIVIGMPDYPMPEEQTDELHLGCQSAAKITWQLKWQYTTINGRITPRTGTGNDGSEWHHFQLLNPSWYGFTENVGAELTSTSGNPDLYVQPAINPTLTAYECAPLANGTTTERCLSQGTLRFYSVRNRSTTQTSVYQLQLIRGGFPPIL